jgi:phage FluMu protein Com
MKKKIEIKTAYYSTDQLLWFKCPHCKKMIVASGKEANTALREWRKVAPKNKKQK